MSTKNNPSALARKTSPIKLGLPRRRQSVVVVVRSIGEAASRVLPFLDIQFLHSCPCLGNLALVVGADGSKCCLEDTGSSRACTSLLQTVFSGTAIPYAMCVDNFPDCSLFSRGFCLLPITTVEDWFIFLCFVCRKIPLTLICTSVVFLLLVSALSRARTLSSFRVLCCGLPQQGRKRPQ